MDRLALAVAIWLAAYSDAEESALDACRQPGEPTACALSADDECRTAGGSSNAAEQVADTGACTLEALQRKSHASHAAPTSLQNPAAAGDAPERELTRAEVEAEYEQLFRAGKLDKYLGGESEPMLGASPEAKREGSGLGEVLGSMLALKLDAINRKLHEVIPDSIADVYETNTTSKMCCAGTPWGCLCHCELIETVQVQNLTNASSVSIMRIGDVTAIPAPSGPMHLAIGMNLTASDLSIFGHAERAVKACAYHLGRLRGGLWLEASMNATASMSGVLVVKHGRMCFKCKSVELHIQPRDVRFERERISVGSWNILKLQGSFWNRVAHHFPTKELVNDLSKVADKAIPKALRHEDLCF